MKPLKFTFFRRRLFLVFAFIGVLTSCSTESIRNYDRECFVDSLEKEYIKNGDANPRRHAEDDADAFQKILKSIDTNQLKLDEVENIDTSNIIVTDTI